MSSTGAQLIIHTLQADGTFQCLGFTGAPVVNPVMIALSCAPTIAARAHLATLKADLIARTYALAPKLAPAAMRCSGTMDSPSSCMAFAEPDTQKVLVLVGDDSYPLNLEPYMERWLAAGLTARVLPVFPRNAKASMGTLLPAKLSHINSDFWTTSITQTIPTILSLANITPHSPRIFISYRQVDSASLAIQLFDALSHAGFETFLDHFRIPPGVNFQAKLTQELGDKAMVVVIESPRLLESDWVKHEINVAKVNSLGVFALQAPGGEEIDGIDSSYRLELKAADFAGGSFSSTAVLQDAIMAEVIDRLKAEHDRALIRRRQILHDSLEGALASEGVSITALTPQGIVPVTAKDGTQYFVWLTPRPPELLDFHTVHGITTSRAKGVIVGLSRLMEPLRFEQTNWLAGLSSITMVEEGQLRNAAKQMAKGTL
jgi:TIR domain